VFTSCAFDIEMAHEDWTLRRSRSANLAGRSSCSSAVCWRYKPTPSLSERRSRVPVCRDTKDIASSQHSGALNYPALPPTLRVRVLNCFSQKHATPVRSHKMHAIVKIIIGMVDEEAIPIFRRWFFCRVWLWHILRDWRPGPGYFFYNEHESLGNTMTAVNFYRAMLRRTRLCHSMSTSSVCPSVRLSVCLSVWLTIQVPWSHGLVYLENNVTAESLRYLLTLTLTSAIWSNGNTPKLGWTWFKVFCAGSDAKCVRVDNVAVFKI